ncbi:nuclear receptor coactivator 7 isoform X3 [Hydra vulgaris]|uniref:nuclear receptor coactivator 7 isoform X3 n=1 Tax=Hydra vulgaris TaxID=6087 RepID=UPI001F5F8C18|nr:nuclear receptor coactivator 7 isoform X1 [Hydra vulgaris]
MYVQLNKSVKMKVAQPPGTVEYIVKTTDTLASISLRYNTTPSELSRLNHLNSYLLWPGQSLFVPKGCREKDSSDVELDDSSNYLHSIPKNVSHPAKSAVHSSRDESSDFIFDFHKDDDELSRKYLKVYSKLITDGQGIVSGVFLITKQTVMFNPDVSDHLVIEHGRQPYIIKLDIKAIRKISFYEDIADMVTDNIKMQFLPSKCLNLNNLDPGLHTYPGVIVCEETGKEFSLAAMHKTYSKDNSIQDDLQVNCVETNTQNQNTDDVHSEGKIQDSEDAHMHQGSSVLKVCSSHNDSILMEDRNLSSTPKHSLKQEGIEIQFKHISEDSSKNQIELLSSGKSVDDHKHFINLEKSSLVSVKSGETSPDSAYLTAQSISSTEISDTEKLYPVLTNQNFNINKRNIDLSKDSGISDMHHYSSQVSQDAHHLLQTTSSIINEAHESKDSYADSLFDSHTELQPHDAVPTLTHGLELCENRRLTMQRLYKIRRNAVSRKNQIEHYVDPMIYLSISVGKNYWVHDDSKFVSIMGVPQNRNVKKMQHWFAIPKEWVDQLYDFLIHWAPNLKINPYLTLDDIDQDLLTSQSTSPSAIENLLMVDESGRSSKSGSIASLGSITRSDADEDLELFENSTLLSKRQSYELYRRLPSRAVGHSWELVYSTSVHGISLLTLYRNFQSYESPALIIIKDEKDVVFGSFLSEPPKISDGFYGNGESMLFSFKDRKLKIYKWSGKNNFFIKGSKNSFVIGGGDGIFGLWLDEDLDRGRSHSCRTFDNLTLSGNEDFKCAGLEAWGMI